MARIVLTGGHGCGKTSIALRLDMLGHEVIREAASDVQRVARARGIPFPTDSDDFEEQALTLHLARERRRLVGGGDIFLDRGAPDHVAYSRAFGWPLPPDLERQALETRYDAILLVEPHSEEWAERVGELDRKDSERLVKALVDVYGGLGYKIKTVPPGDLNTRVALVLSCLKTT